MEEGSLMQSRRGDCIKARLVDAIGGRSVLQLLAGLTRFRAPEPGEVFESFRETQIRSGPYATLSRVSSVLGRVLNVQLC